MHVKQSALKYVIQWSKDHCVSICIYVQALAQEQLPDRPLRISLLQISRTPAYEPLSYYIPHGSALGRVYSSHNNDFTKSCVFTYISSILANTLIPRTTRGARGVSCRVRQNCGRECLSVKLGDVKADVYRPHPPPHLKTYTFSNTKHLRNVLDADVPSSTALE
jgi:hypothetical protein